AVDGEIVLGHGQVDVEDALAAGEDAAAELGFFAGDERFVEAADVFEGLAAEEGVASAEGGEAGGVDPVEVEDAVVEGALGVELAAMAPDAGDGGVGEG